MMQEPDHEEDPRLKSKTAINPDQAKNRYPIETNLKSQSLKCSKPGTEKLTG